MKLSGKKILQWPALPSLVLAILFFGINLIVTPGFLSSFFVRSFLSTNVPLICTAIGCAAVLIGGGMDISIGAMVTLINVVFVKMNETGLPLGLSIVLALLLGTALGAINGFTIGCLRVTPLLATFASSSLFAGLALWILPTPGGRVAEPFARWYNGAILGIPTSLLFVIIILLIWAFALRTKLRYWLYSSGKNQMKAYVSGVPVKLTQFSMYTFAGLTAGISALALSGSIRGGDPLVGLPMSMNSIAACVIGGISLSGGSGLAIGAIFGALFQSFVTTAVFSAKIQPFYQDLATGVILLAGVICSLLIERRTNSGSKIKKV